MRSLTLDEIHHHWFYKNPENSDQQIDTTSNITEQTDITDVASNHDNDTDPESDAPADTHRGIANEEENEISDGDSELPPLIIDSALLQIIEPNLVQPKGRPPVSCNKKRSRDNDDEDTSTRRNPSGFELVMTADQVEQLEHTAEANAFYGTPSRGGARGRATSTQGGRGRAITTRGGKGRGATSTTRGGGRRGGARAGRASGIQAITGRDVAGDDAALLPPRRRNLLPERYANDTNLLDLNFITGM